MHILRAAHRRSIALAVALGLLGLSALVAPAGAAGSLGQNFDYGVFVDGRRVQVSAAPIAIRAGAAFRIQGWVVDARTMKPGLSLLVSTDGGIPKPVGGYKLRRPDVARALHDPDAETSGFEFPVAAGMPAGVHRFHFILVGKDGSLTGLATDVLVNVTGS